MFGIASAFAPMYSLMLVFRGVVGFGIGGIPVSFSMFMEIVPTANRGLWSLVVESSWTIGTVLSALIAWAVLPPLNWQYLLGIATTPIFIFLIFFLTVHESPRYLMRQGKHKKAEEVLRKIAQYNGEKTMVNLTLLSHNTPLVGHHSQRGSVYGSDENGYEPIEHYGGVDNCPNTPADPPETLQTNDGDNVRSGSLKITKSQTKLQKWTASFKESQFAQNVREIVIKPEEAHMRRLTLLLWWIWAAVSFAYYGLVLLTTELQLSEGPDGCDASSPDHADLSGKQKSI